MNNPHSSANPEKQGTTATNSKEYHLLPYCTLRQVKMILNQLIAQHAFLVVKGYISVEFWI